MTLRTLALAPAALAPAALALCLALGTMSIATPALAKAPAAAAAAARTFNISKEARPAIVALQAAINANDTAGIPGKMSAAQALAKTNDDKYVIAQLQLKTAKTETEQRAALEALLASNAVAPADQLLVYTNLGKLAYNAKDYAKATASFQRAVQLDPNNIEALSLLGESYEYGGNHIAAATALQQALKAASVGGAKPEEKIYRRAISIAYNNHLSNAYQLARDWVAAYPGTSNWRDALRIYQNNSNLEDGALVDLFRLQRAVGTFNGSSDYYRAANASFGRGFSGEAKAILDEGIAAKQVDRNAAAIRELYNIAASKSAGDRASLTAGSKTALASPNAKGAMSIGEAYFGYGDYAQAAAMARAAMGKTGVDANLANLRLGMALARAGDKAGAVEALGKAGGSQAEIAKYWLLYISTR